MEKEVEEDWEEWKEEKDKSNYEREARNRGEALAWGVAKAALISPACVQKSVSSRNIHTNT